MIINGTVRNLEEPDYSLWGNLQTTGRREDVGEDNLLVGLTHSTLEDGKAGHMGKGLALIRRRRGETYAVY